MDNHQHTQGPAQADEHEARVAGRVIGVGDDETLGVLEDGPGLVEADAVLPEIGGGLDGVPFEAKLDQTDRVCTTCGL